MYDEYNSSMLFVLLFIIIHTVFVLQFATEYFPHPTYKDQALTFYNALGSGKMSIGFNPLAMIKLIRDSMKRIKELGVKSYNTKGKILYYITCVLDHS